MKDGSFEIRKYPAQLWAFTTTSENYKSSQSKSFRRLFKYISGKNNTKRKIAMTAPVTEKEENLKIAMTAPVTRKASVDGWIMSFAMPAQFKSLDELPKPLDPSIKLSKSPPRLFAVHRYTWRSNQKRKQEKFKQLEEWLLTKTKYKSISGPTFAGYDPPWTIPFLRRQEVLLEIIEKK